MVFVTPSDITGFNTLLIAVTSGLVGWAFQDLRRRVAKLEKQTAAITAMMFYWAMRDPNVPAEAMRALEKAMLAK